jgi:hypothetical protein
MVAISTASPRATSLQRTFASAFLALADHGRSHPGEAQEIAAACASHLRSAFPMAHMIDSAPFVRIDPEPTPAAAIERAIGNGTYRVSTDDGHVLLTINEDGVAIAVLTAKETETLRADLAAVAASAGKS